MTGRFYLSLDFELGWGVIENGRWKERQQKGVYKELRPVLTEFLDFLAEREIALDWATVGAMIAERQEGEFDHLPQNLVAPIDNFLNTADADTIDGRDLFDKLLACRTAQNIGSHSYSHTRFSRDGYSVDAQTADLRKAQDVLKAWGCEPDFFVFPVNHDKTYMPLADNGIRSGRGKPLYKKSVLPSPLNRMLQKTIACPPAVQENEIDGVTRHHGSLFYNWYGKHASIMRHFVNLQASRALSNVVAGNSQHFWIHPFNLVDTPGHFGDLKHLLGKVADLRDAGKIEIGAM